VDRKDCSEVSCETDDDASVEIQLWSDDIIANLFPLSTRESSNQHPEWTDIIIEEEMEKGERKHVG
jgi:hypothetical protein